MHKLLNILFTIFLLFFFLNIYKYYSSSINIKTRDFNRNNINQIIIEMSSELPTLINDTNNVIEFNDSISSEINNDKPRSFWNLLRSK